MRRIFTLSEDVRTFASQLLARGANRLCQEQRLARLDGAGQPVTYELRMRFQIAEQGFLDVDHLHLFELTAEDA